MFNFRLTGQKAVARAFKKLPAKMAKKGIRKGLRAGAKIMANQIKVEAPKETGLLKKQVKVRARKRSTKFIGVNASAVDPKTQNEFYGNFIEYGSNNIDKNPFVENSFQKSKKQAETIAAKTIKSETDKLLKSEGFKK
jgi:HK97 gp10 family phage protein